MTAIRMMKATKSTAPKDVATIITEGEELLLSSMMILSVDFALVGVKTVVEDPRFNALLLSITP